MESIEITREELYRMIWSEPMSRLAKKYKISDNGLRKKCKKLAIPLPPTGYWQMINSGKKVKRPALKRISGNTTTVLEKRDTKENAESYITTLNKQKRKIEEDYRIDLRVPNRLNRPHAHIKATKEYLKNVNHNFEISRYAARLDIYVSKKQLRRALLIMDTLIKAIYGRGHYMTISAEKTEIVIGSYKENICVREKFEAVTIDNEGAFYDKQQESKLAIRASYRNEKEWIDTAIPLEKKISAIIAWFEIKAQKFNEERERQNEKLRLEEEREKARLEKEKIKNDELKKVQELLIDVARYHQAKAIRDYLTVITENNGEQIDSDWMDWAKQKADWLDPQVRKVDETLEDFQYEYFEPNILDFMHIGKKESNRLNLHKRPWFPGKMWYQR